MAKAWVAVAKVDDVPPGEVRVVDTPDGGSIAICNADGKFYAVEDVCTHARATERNSTSGPARCCGRPPTCRFAYSRLALKTAASS